MACSQVASFVRAMPKERWYDVVTQILAYGGLRWAEIQPTKTYERRYVPLPGKVVEHLGRHLETVPSERGSLVFTTRRGTPLRNQNFRRSYFALLHCVLVRHLGSRRMASVTRAQAFSSTREPIPSQCSGTSVTVMSLRPCGRRMRTAYQRRRSA
jgi:hypothetical protein